MKQLICSCCLSIIANFLFAQTVSPQRESDFVLYWKMGDSSIKFVSLLHQKLEAVPNAGQPVWLLTQTYSTDKATDADSTFFTPKKWQPLAYRTNIKSSAYREIVSFAPDSINVSVLYKDSLKQFRYAAGQSYIQATTQEYFIGQLPLQMGYDTSFRTINAGLNYADINTTVQVLGKENLPVPGIGNIPCWKLRVGTGLRFSIQWYAESDGSLMLLEFTSRKGVFIKRRML
ncbi:MAG: hypothetical protein GXC72_07895 [Chitinophagaceae bacterium]|nr:hypothetical protein [Chitinophagaceae bacterium]